MNKMDEIEIKLKCIEEVNRDNSKFRYFLFAANLAILGYILKYTENISTYESHTWILILPILFTILSFLSGVRSQEYNNSILHLNGDFVEVSSNGAMVDVYNKLINAKNNRLTLFFKGQVYCLYASLFCFVIWRIVDLLF